ncbi:KilA-N domain-containing protein [Aquitalea sp. LB_tupeE]|uniref:KilA-N domain-containing protein n=1 Tax=Aquitalea sp. LB_tupeE TaxID=2748078 RepID=UPI0015BDDF7F|nr:KilA-N domain-containing protein [Aquitalea sp. LB_tupeE]NWK79810.1 KilA-N domain-containing protein [Aquitalea sp. LB_tupeE]
MSKQIIQADFNGQAMHFTADAWFNATVAAEKYGKVPNEWLRLPDTERYLAALARKYGKIPYFKTKRGQTGGTWLHPKLAVRFAQWLNDDFAIWCDEQIDGLMRGHAGVDDWHTARIEAASRFRGVCDMLNLSRQADGKTTARHHYSNEALLINEVLTGQRSALDRNSLSKTDLRLLELLEAQDMVLLGRGMAYDERKQALHTFAQEQRQRLAANDASGRLTA